MLSGLVVLMLLVLLVLSWAAILILLLMLALWRAVSGVQGPVDVPTLHQHRLCGKWQGSLWRRWPCWHWNMLPKAAGCVSASVGAIGS